MPEKKAEEILENDFLPYINKWPRLLALLCIITGILPPLAVTWMLGYAPSWPAVGGGLVLTITAIGAFYVIEPISYFPVLGQAGTYIAFTSGNISNMRLPCGAAAQDATGVEPGTPEGSVISTIGAAASVFVNITILTAGMIAGAAALQALPDVVMSAFRLYLLPAIFGAIFGRFAEDMPKLGVVALSISLPLTWLYMNGYLAFFPGVPLYVILACAVFGTILTGRWMADHGYIETEE